MIIFHNLSPIYSEGVSFKLLSGTDMQNSAADEGPYIRKEFFQCGRKQSCTHVIELFSGFVLANGSIELEERKYGAVRIYEKVKLNGK